MNHYTLHIVFQPHEAEYHKENTGHQQPVSSYMFKLNYPLSKKGGSLRLTVQHR